MRNIVARSWDMRRRFRSVLSGLRRYPTVCISVLVILFLVGLSIYAMVTVPLSEAVDLWNAHESEWREVPRAVPPAWTNLFRREKLPKTLIVPVEASESWSSAINETAARRTLEIPFDYPYSVAPTEAAFYYDLQYDRKKPILKLIWIRPDGIEIELFNGTPRGGRTRLALEPDELLVSSESLGEQSSRGTRLPALEGEHRIRAEIITFEETFSFGGEIILYGGVYGIAGTDFNRRDLSLGLMWGTPIALMLGLIAATGTTLLGFCIAAIGGWLGGWVDAGIQRLTEINMMIPFLPVILMVGWFFSSSIWVLLGFIVGFSIFTGRLKSYRAMFLQLRNAPYIEAARAYGASNTRIIFRYLIPHVFPAVLPHIILGVPIFVFLEASLAFLGISDPELLTWGKILSEAREALYMGYYHWVLGPAFLLLLTGLSFSMLGYTLDRVFNPRLRDA